MHLPAHVHEQRKKHLALASAATAASNSATAPGTGKVHIPVYWFISASAGGSAAIFNGTGGSLLLTYKIPLAGGSQDGYFWDDEITANKALVIETQGTVGVNDFHVWYVTKRIAAGNSGTEQ